MVKTIFAIDPGPVESGYCVLRGRKIISFGKIKNECMHTPMQYLLYDSCCIVAIEKIASYGMAVGAEVFETAFWCGRFYQQVFEHFSLDIERPTRKEIVVHLCGSPKAKDANVRQALIDRWGEPGKKSAPGPTFGISGDMWAALAVATYVLDTVQQ